MPSTPATRGPLLIVIAAVLWGTSGVIGRAATDDGVTALAVAAARLGVAALALSPFTVRLLRDLPSRPQLLAIGGTGVLLALYQATYFSAVDRAGVTTATLVSLGSGPVFTALGGRLVGDGVATARTWVAAALAVGGVGLLTAGGQVGARDPVGGVALALVAGAGFAGVTLLGRLVGGVAPIRVVATAMAIGAVLLLPVTGGLVEAGPSTATALLFLGLGPTALAYVAFIRGMSVVPAATASILTLMEPVTAALLAAVLFGERLGPIAAIGVALVLLGSVVSARGARVQSVPSDASG